MVEVAKKSQPKFIAHFLEALRDELMQGGIKAEVDSEAVVGTKLHRVIVVSPNFRHVRQGERQDLVWRIADTALPPEYQLRISMILTLTPAEMQGDLA
jgi:hypothetical protein